MGADEEIRLHIAFLPLTLAVLQKCFSSQELMSTLRQLNKGDRSAVWKNNVTFRFS
jgi:hypothetical protein